MSELLPLTAQDQAEHMSWVRTRMTLDKEFIEWIRHGFSLIAVGFGSFAFLDGLVGGLGEHAVGSASEPSRIFSLTMTFIGTLLIIIALRHYRLMVEFVNLDEFGEQPVLELPNEKRDEYLAVGAVGIGVISFMALLVLR